MAFGYTKTLPTISGSHSDFTVLFRTSDLPTEAIDGGASSLLNGGGDLRAYTDDTKTTRLPVDIVVFVTGGTPDITFWVLLPTAATSNTIYIEADDVETTQPAVGAAFGRNAVWVNENVVLDLTNAVPSAVVDRTGNNATVNDFGSMGTGDSEGLTFDGTNDCLEVPDDASLDLVSAYSGRAICKLDQSAGFEAIINKPAQATVSFPFGMWNLYKTDGNKVDVRVSEDLVTTASVTSTSNAAESTPEEKQCGGVYDKTDIVSFVNGVEEGSTSFTPDIGTSNFSLWIGAFNQFNEFVSGKIRFVAVREAVLSANWMKTEYENQLSAGSWGTNSTWSSGAIEATAAFSTTHNKVLGSAAIFENLASILTNLGYTSTNNVVFNTEAALPVISGAVISNNLVLEAAATIPTFAGHTTTRQAIFEAGSSFSVDSGVDQGSQANLEASANIASQLGITATTGNIFETSAALGVSNTLTVDVIATYLANVSASITNTLTIANDAVLNASVLLATDQSIVTLTGSNVEATAAYLINNSYSSIVDLSVEATTTFAVSCSIAAQVLADLYSEVEYATVVALIAQSNALLLAQSQFTTNTSFSVITEKIIEASGTLTVTSTLTSDGTVTVDAGFTPLQPGRNVTVLAQDRIVTVL